MSKSKQAMYNPGIHGDENLITGFVVRGHYLDLILEHLKEHAGAPSRHLIVVGPRGIGKTTLVRRVAAEVRMNEELSAGWYPIVFAEEAYEVGTPGEFWLTALFHLSDRTQDQRLLRAYDDIKKETDEARLRERALAQLMDFADTQDKHILLIVENLNMILGQQLSDHDAWVLRHTLQNESRLMLLGTAPARFKEIEHVNKAWFEILTVYELKPLDESESTILWKSLTSEELSDTRLRPLQILTGGNPRLLSILAGFAIQTSFRELMDNLIQLIDDHTEYFKGQLDGLAAMERKVFVAILDLWDPSTASQVAAEARISVSKASSLLGRLSSRGAISVAKSGRRKLYQATERLYNIYYLMRRRGHPSDRVHAVVTFMIQFYEGDQLINTATQLAEEACRLGPENRLDHFYAYRDIVQHMPEPDRLKIVEGTPREFFSAPDTPDVVKELALIEAKVVEQQTKSPSTLQKVLAFIKRGSELMLARDSFAEAQEAFEEAIKLDEANSLAWYSLGLLHEQRGSVDDADRCFRRSLDATPDNTAAWRHLAIANESRQNYQEADVAWRRASELEPNDISILLARGQFLKKSLDNNAEAETCFRRALELAPDSYEGWLALAQVLHDREEYQEAEFTLRKAVELEPGSGLAWAHLGHILSLHLNETDKAEEAFRKAIELDNNNHWAWSNLGELLKDHSTRYEEAEHALRRALELKSDDAWALAELGHLLSHYLERHGEGEELLLKAVETDPQEVWAWQALVRLQLESGKDDEAELTLRRSTDANPQSEDLWGTLGHLLYRGRRLAEAEKAFRKVIALDQNAVWAQGHIGEINRELGNYEVAREFLGRVVGANPSNAWGWINLAKLYEDLHQQNDAAEAYEKAIAIDPDCKKSWQSWKNLLTFLLANRSNDALLYARRFAAKPDNDSSSLSSLAKLFYEKAPRECLPEAETWARTALELAPLDKQWIAGQILAGILGAQSKWKDALEISRVFLDAAASEREAIKPATEFIVSAASEGHAQAALDIVVDSKGVQALEPLVVGLKLFLGDVEYKAKEIVEIGQDVEQRIRELQAKKHSKHGEDSTVTEERIEK